MDSDFFGSSIAIDGDIVLVGSYNDDDKGSQSGSAYVFEKPIGGWSNCNETAKLNAADGISGDRFGAVAISGNTSLIGAYSDSDNGYQSGSAYIISLNFSSLTTDSLSSITTTTATGNGNITDLGGLTPTQHGVCWSTTENPTMMNSHSDEGAVSSTGPFSSLISGLLPGTTYWVRSYVSNGFLSVYGNGINFTTNSIAPTITSQAVSSITTTTATGNGNITDLGGPNPTQHGVCWSTISNPTISDNKTEEGTASATGAFTSSITGLSPNTTYHVRAYATNAAGTVYGADVSFSTDPITATVTTQAVSSITATSATGNGNVTDLGAPNPTQYGVCWSTTSNPTISDNKTEEGTALATGAFTSSITGLSPNTTYHVRAYATNAAGTVYGTDVFFMTSPKAPTITTQAVSSITTTTATGNGNITDFGAPNPTQHGVCWSTTSNPTTSNNKTEEGAATATGAFTSPITGLSPGTTYHVRAYATNAAGTVYGADESFSTFPQYSVVFQTDGTEGATLTGLTNQTVNHGDDCSQVKANTPNFHTFAGWSGDFTGNPNPLTVTNVTSNMTITANFAINTYLLTYNDGLHGSITGIKNQTVDHGSDGTAVTAVSDAGYHFVDWSDGSIDNPRTDTNVTDDLDVTANYAENILTVSIGSDSISENGGTSEATVTRNSGTNGDLTVNLASDDTTEATVPVTVTIPDGSSSVEFTVTAIDDNLIDGTQTITISATAVNYNEGTDVLDITDDDLTLTMAVSGSGTTSPVIGSSVISLNTPQAISATPDGGNHFVKWTHSSGANIANSNSPSTNATLSLDATITANFAENELAVSINSTSISENGGTSEATVTRNSGTTGDLTVNLTSDDTSEATVPATVTIPDGSSSVDFTVTAIDDDIIDGGPSVTVTATATNYVGGEDTIKITDDDIPGFSVTPTSLSFEEGTKNPFNVVLTAEPDMDVVFTVTSSAIKDATVDKNTLTFTPGNWDIAQTVTVTAVDDTENGAGSSTITVAVDDSSDGNFLSLPDQAVAVSISDDDPTASNDTAVVGLLEAEVIDVLENDTDPQGDGLTVTAITSAPSAGTAEITNAGKSITYTAPANSNIITFDYQVSDGNGGISEATVTVTVGKEVAYGLCFTIKASDHESLEPFMKKPKITASYVDPIKKKEMRGALKVLTKVPSLNGATVTEIECEWKRSIFLYNKKTLALAYKTGSYTSTYLNNNPLKTLICSLNVQAQKADGSKISVPLFNKKLILAAPEITDVEKWDGSALGTDPVQFNGVIVLKGKYFGTKAPKAWLEYIDAKGKLKKQRLLVQKIFKYVDAKGKAGKSCMDITTGDSEIRVQLPKKWWKGWTAGSYDLVIDNKVGMTTTSILTAHGSNTAPTVTADTFGVTAGEKYYQLDILANDSDVESDFVTIVFENKITSQLGKVNYDKKTGKVKYTPPKDKIAPYTDTFKYTLNDGHSAEGSWPTTVTVTINVN